VLHSATAAAAAMSSSSPSSKSTSTCAANNKKTSSSPAALIFLHGLGDTPAGWSSLEYTLPSLQKSLSSSGASADGDDNPQPPLLRYVFPHAPTIGISINGGAQMPGWFDLFDWPIEVGCQDDRDGIMAGVAQIDAVADKLRTEHNIPRSRIVVGGFSQGGSVAMIAAYMKKQTKKTTTDEDDDEPYAGCVALSGWLTLVEELQKAGLSEKALKSTPLFWGHGQYDDKVLFEQQPFGINKLTELGLERIEATQYPMGHQSCPEESSDVTTFLHSILFQEEKGTDEKDS